jgi:hypothetical protein
MDLESEYQNCWGPEAERNQGSLVFFRNLVSKKKETKASDNGLEESKGRRRWVCGGGGGGGGVVGCGFVVSRGCVLSALRAVSSL